jgi:hexosaminidase
MSTGISGGTAQEAAIIPRPLSLERGAGHFILAADAVLAADAACAAEAEQLAGCLRPATGFALPIVASPGGRGSVISLALDKTLAGLGEEGYRLEAAPGRVSLVAPAPAGLFRAAQTLRQLLPPEIFGDRPAAGVAWRVPGVRIEDRPRFRWRGLMLDTGHDFQRLPFILRFIDLMALHKFNVFHWHISDLGTFPLEIRGYPRLQHADTLGKRLRGEPPRGVKPGRYSQEEAREVVRHAAARHVTVVPEIDMPGHATPVLTAYPELDCPVPHRSHGEFDRWEYCLGNEKTYRFLEDVLSQVMEIFPSTHVHIGGDECPKEQWLNCPLCRQRMAAEGLQSAEELQSCFVRRIGDFLRSRGRRLIGWDEIMEGGPAPGATVMAWRPRQNAAVAAARAGHDVIQAPSSHLYFDYPESSTPIEKVYGFEPVPPELAPAEAGRILGAQAQMWTDNHPTEPEIERLVYPRACAVAEVTWSPAASRDLGDFTRRLGPHRQRLAALGIGSGTGGTTAGA